MVKEAIRSINNMRLFKYISILVVIALGTYLLFFRENPYQEISGRTFGTYYNIKIKTEHKNRLLTNRIKEELDKINSEMSVFEPGSEINTINETGAHQAINLSDNMAKLMRSADEIYRLTDGNFDPTVGQLVDLWGFGAGQHSDIPTDQQIKDTLKSTGFNKLSFANNYKIMQKSNADTLINLSAIAKGHAVDRVSAILKNAGYKDYIVDIGGEIYASGAREEGVNGWNIGIAAPNLDNAPEENAAVIRLHNMAVATSGDYRNYYYKNNKRYSHTISPQTGYPVEHNLASATVFDSNCMRADALATALMAMGEEKGLKFANKNKIPVIFFTRNEYNETKMISSNEAQKLLDKYQIVSEDATSTQEKK